MPNTKFSIDPDRLRRFLREADLQRAIGEKLNEERAELRRQIMSARTSEAHLRSGSVVDGKHVERAQSELAELEAYAAQLGQEIAAVHSEYYPRRNLAESCREFAKANNFPLPIAERLGL